LNFDFFRKIKRDSPLGAERGQCEHGHADGHVLGGLTELAYELAVWPRLDRVHGGRERHARDDDQQVAQCQAQYVRVGHAAHAPVPDEHQHQRAVAQYAHYEDHGEHHRNDVRLRPVGVRFVNVVVRRVATDTRVVRGDRRSHHDRFDRGRCHRVFCCCAKQNETDRTSKKKKKKRKPKKL